MDPDIPKFQIADVVESIAGRDKGTLYYVIDGDDTWLLLVNGKGRTMENPKRKKCKHTNKVLRSETRVAQKLRNGDQVLNSELRRDLAYISRELQGNTTGG